MWKTWRSKVLFKIDQYFFSYMWVYRPSDIHIGSLSWLGSRDSRFATFREIHLPSSANHMESPGIFFHFGHLNNEFSIQPCFIVMKVKKKIYHHLSQPWRIVDFLSRLQTLGNQGPHPRLHDVAVPTLGYIVYIVVWCWRKLLPDTLINHKQIGQCLNHHGNGTRCLAIRNTSCPWVRYWFVDCLRTGGLDTWVTKVI